MYNGVMAARDESRLLNLFASLRLEACDISLRYYTHFTVNLLYILQIQFTTKPKLSIG